MFSLILLLQEPAKFTYTIPSQNSLISLNFSDLQAYGYTVDKAGFMGADFNKAAGLPQDFKIHKSTLDELSRFAERNHVLNRIKSKDEQIKIFDNIDMADTIKHYYRLFDQMTSALGDDKKSYTLADIGKLPKGYSTKGTHYDAKGHLLKDLSSSTISNIYSSADELNSAKTLSKELTLICRYIKQMKATAKKLFLWDFCAALDHYQVIVQRLS